ncbi:hypothetical protein TSOC_001099, partial [Tetrabaena socialis]
LLLLCRRLLLVTADQIHRTIVGGRRRPSGGAPSGRGRRHAWRRRLPLLLLAWQGRGLVGAAARLLLLREPPRVLGLQRQEQQRRQQQPQQQPRFRVDVRAAAPPLAASSTAGLLLAASRIANSASRTLHEALRLLRVARHVAPVLHAAPHHGGAVELRREPPPPPPPPCPIKLYTQFGQLAKDVLYGSRKEGMYGGAGVFKFTLTSSTSTGLTLSSVATSSGPGSLSGQLLAARSTKDGWLSEVLLTSGGVAECTLSRAFTPTVPSSATNGGGSDKDAAAASAPPLKLGTFRLGGVVPVPAFVGSPAPPKVTLDYSGTYLHAKTSATVDRLPTLTASAVGRVGCWRGVCKGKGG